MKAVGAAVRRPQRSCQEAMERKGKQMIREFLRVSLDSVEGGKYDTSYGHLDEMRIPRAKGEQIDKEMDALIMKTFVEFGGKFEEINYGQIDLDSPRLGAFLDRLHQLEEEEAVAVRSMSVEREMVDDEMTPGEWFCVHSKAQLSETGDFKADRVRPGVHIAGECGRWDLHWVSEKFRRICEKNGLTGVRFRWVGDKGRYRAPQWFVPIPTQFLGRGLDHPWFDRANAKPVPGEIPLARLGCCHAGERDLKNGVHFGDPAKDRILREFTGRVYFNTCSSFLREYLPATDFAMACHYTESTWMWYINRNARDILIREGVLLKSECDPVMIVDALPEGVMDLDKDTSPPDVFKGKDMKAECEKAEEAYREFLTHPKPVREAKIATSLKKLKALKKRDPKSFRKGIKAADQEHVTGLPFPLPEAWRQLLEVTDGGELPNDCEVIPLGKLARFHSEWKEDWTRLFPDSRSDLFYVAHHGTGDAFALVMSEARPDGECPVLHISHEGGLEERSWPSIAAFLEDMMKEEEED